MSANIVLGVVTVIMTLLGAAVSLLPPESLHAHDKRWVKACYAGAFLVLGVIAIICVIKQSKETVVANQNLSNALGNLGQSTGDIARMTTLNNQLQEKLLKQSDAITELSKQNISAITGGNTFCYVMASPIYSEFGLNIITVGKSPLHDVSVWMIDIDTMRQVVAGKPSLSYEDIQSYTINFPTIPFLASSTTRMLTRIATGVHTKRNLQITFSSLNGIWSETLKLELVNGHWAQALKVGKIISPVKGGTPNEKLTTPLYNFATDNFPKRDGKVDWDN